MAEDLDIVVENEASEEGESSERRLRAVIGDAFAFIRSQEANAALATVTLEQLMNDQIARNGDSDSSNAAQYDPYTFDHSKETPASSEPAERANFLGGSDTERPTKFDRVNALVEAIEAVVEDIKAKDPVEVADPEAYADAAEDSI